MIVNKRHGTPWDNKKDALTSGVVRAALKSKQSAGITAASMTTGA